MDYAGFWRRNCALTVDFIVFICLFFALKELIGHNFFVLNLVYQVICLAYFVLLTASEKQATLGQMVFKIKIGDVYGDGLNIVQSLYRYFVWGLPLWPLVIYSSLPYTAEIAKKFDAVSNNPELIEGLLKDSDLISYMEVSGVLSIVILVGSIIWYLPIAFMKEKTGLHDLICKQRAFKTVKEEI